MNTNGEENNKGYRREHEICFRILADYRLRHLVNNVAMHMITLE
jgi:hypothetical protein